MNVTCTHCETVFRVDENRVPTNGVLARCSNCSGVFRVERQRVAGAQAEAIQPEATPAPSATVAENREPGASVPAQSETVPSPESDDSEDSDELPTLAPSEPGHAAQPAASAGERASAVNQERAVQPAVSPFGTTDPAARARRLARALVSDIVVYHPERRERARQNGTLRQEFREEIRKSWDEFVAQVGTDTARSTPYFREALNELLAGGERIF